MKQVRGAAVALIMCGLLAAPRSGAAAVPADTVKVTIRSTAAALAFEPDEITVRPGATVRILYINDSPFSHNLVIVKKDDDIDVIGAASFDAHDTGFVPMQHKNRMIAYSPLAAAGKTVEFAFTAPAAGEYPFVCFVDGHFNMMVGKLKVR